MQKLLPGSERLGTQARVHRDRQGHAVTKIYWEHQRKWYYRELYWLLKLQDCPYTPKVIAYDEATSTITMEYVGVDLYDLADPRKELPEDWKVQIHRIYKSLRAVGCSHNDITPSNMTLHKGQLYLIDFSLATGVNENPEQVFGRRTMNYLGDFHKPTTGTFDDKYSLRDSIHYIMKVGRWAPISKDTGEPYSEVNTLIVWGEDSNDILEKVTTQVSKTHAILGIHPFKWTEENRVANLSRLYSTFLGKGSPKYKLSELDQTGRLTLITYTVTDPAVGRTAENKRVNEASWALKRSLREKYGYKIHASNHQYEASRDLKLFFGLKPREYLAKYKEDPFFGEEERVETRDLIGASGWSDVFEMLRRKPRFYLMRLKCTTPPGSNIRLLLTGLQYILIYGK